jgi:hypothetical protein
MSESKIEVERGRGQRFNYCATNCTPGGEWLITYRPIPITPPEPPQTTYIDMRGQLPVRAGVPPYPSRPAADLTLFVAHYTAGPVTSTVTDIARYQTGPSSHLPFPAIAYHWFVEQDGKLSLCHDLATRTWGSDGSYQSQHVNAIGVHCCYAGNTQPNAAQIAGMKQSRLESERMLGRVLTVRGHSDDSPTQCPGTAWNAWKGQI